MHVGRLGQCRTSSCPLSYGLASSLPTMPS
jgi:hypothetical protein